MNERNSYNQYFILFPKIIQTYFQGLDSTNTKDVENLFKKEMIN